MTDNAAPEDRLQPELLHALPVGATRNDELMAQIDALAAGLPGAIAELGAALDAHHSLTEYDAAANRAIGHVFTHLPEFFAGGPGDRLELLKFAKAHMPQPAQLKVYRRLSKDPEHRIRRRTRTAARGLVVQEVTLPAKAEGAWDTTGWQRGLEEGSITGHKSGARVQKDQGVPPIKTVGELIELLKIKSPKQLGFLMNATDGDEGAYSRFTIPKRDGRERVICAPRPQLRRAQRRLLDEVLSKVAVHDAAHGFVPGRSTVTNATPHLGAAVVVKFDITDFFPTIHYHRVVGLFASLGYATKGGGFSNDPESKEIAPTLARLCVYSEEGERRWAHAFVPQGAPTSPAISNLVSRGLDGRLSGLATKMGGVYTRYADDLTFSFRENVPDLGRLRWWVDQICHQEGFFVNQAKFRVIRQSQRQQVTGIVVNSALRVPREERRRFRAIVHNCQQQGVASQARGRAGFEEYLLGYASYIHMVHPEEGAPLLAEVKALLGRGAGDDEAP